MKKKRTGSALLAILLMLTVAVTGCGGNKNAYKLDPNNPVALTIWHYYNGSQKMAFDQAVAEFNETVGYDKGIIVEAYSQGNVNELLQKVVDSAKKEVGAEELPDIFAAYVDTAYTIDQLGLAADLDQYLSQSDLDLYVDSYIEEGRIDNENHLKIFPVAKATEIMMINKTDWETFAYATGASLNSLSTIEGVTAMAEAYYTWTDSLTPEAGDGKAFFGRDAVANYMLIGNRQLGNEIFQVKNGQIQLNIDEDIYRKLWDNYYVPMIKGHFAAQGRFRSDDAKTGDIIALVCSTSGSMYFPKQVVVNDTESYPIDAITLPAPIFAGAEKCAVQQGAGMMVLNSTPEREYASVEFLKWFTDDERNIAFSLQSGYLPVKKSANDWDKISQNFADQQAAGEEYSQFFVDAMGVAIETVNTNTLYANKPFANGTEARAVLENNMSYQIQRDLEAIQAQVAAGVSREEAVAQFTTEEHFQRCIESFREELSRTVAIH